MERDSFIKLTFGAHRVAKVISEEDEQSGRELIRLANKALVELILFLEKEHVPERSYLGVQVVRSIDELNTFLGEVEREGWVDPKNFFILKKGYESMKRIVESEKPAQVKQGFETPSNLTGRQERIIGILKTRPKIQVWELQKFLPQVTKRTLRRDLDDLLQLNLIERKGEWNSVFYELKK